MGVKVASGCFNWSQPSIPHSPSSPQTLASAISSPSSRRRSFTDFALVCQCVHTPGRSALLGTKLHRSRSCEFPKPRARTITRAASANLDAFSDEEFSKKIQELALRFQLADDNDDEEDNIEAEFEIIDKQLVQNHNQNRNHQRGGFRSNSRVERVEPPDWPGDIIPASIERKANSVELPLSLRMIKRKMQRQEGFREAGESAYCSMKKAFSSMVFIIRELQSYTLQMREILFYEDLQGILVRVQKEMNASFVWLFQQVFSATPTLMVYVMILLANYSVYSMSSNAAIAAATPVQAIVTTTESVSLMEDQKSQFDSSAINTFSVSSGGKTTSVGGINGGGGKFRPLASGTDGDGRFDGSDYRQTIIPDGVSTIGNPTRVREDSVSDQETREEEVSLWNLVVEEAKRVQAVLRDEALDHETTRNLVSPVTAKIEAEDFADYFRTELLYQTGLTQEPHNSLLLANYAQFLYLVVHDYDRAEDYFKRAAKAEPKDAEALSKYASFLWQARKDLWAAEETYLEAISVDPSNSYFAANYAHFLWSTGGEDTCFPLSSPERNEEKKI